MLVCRVKKGHGFWRFITNILDTCARRALERQPKGELINILSDSQAALKALASHQITSKLAWEYLQNLRALAKHNKVTLVWVPGHKGIAGNELANKLARKGSKTTLIGPEPGLAITKALIRCAVAEWITGKHRDYWSNVKGNIHNARMMRKPSRQLADDVLALNRIQLRTVTSLLTGHGCLRKYLHKIGVFKDEPICRLCNKEEKTAYHVVFACAALECQRQSLWAAINPLIALPEKDLPHKLLKV